MKTQVQLVTMDCYYFEHNCICKMIFEIEYLWRCKTMFLEEFDP